MCTLEHFDHFLNGYAIHDLYRNNKKYVSCVFTILSRGEKKYIEMCAIGGYLKKNNKIKKCMHNKKLKKLQCMLANLKCIFYGSLSINE